MRQKTYTIDFETRSAANLKKVGGWNYSKHPSTEVLCMAWAVDGSEEINLWVPGEKFPPIGPNDVIWAHNYLFEIAIWQHVLKREVNLSRWRCTQGLSLFNGGPAPLEQAAEFFKLPYKKDKAGHSAMLKLAKPRKRRKNEPPGVYFLEDPEESKRMYDYCKSDLIVTRELRRVLQELPPFEREVALIDLELNYSGVEVDLPAVRKVLEVYEVAKAHADVEIEKLGTDLRVTTRDQILRYCLENDVELDALTKEHVAEALKGKLPKKVRRVLELRLAFGKSSVSKYSAFLLRTDHDDSRLRDIQQYYGSHTGRFSGKGVQLKNLVRPGDFDSAGYLAEIMAGKPETLAKKYKDRFPDIAARLLRSMIVSTKGMFIADFTKIETFVLFWLAGAKRTVQKLADGEDIYREMAAAIYRKGPAELTVEEVQIGKKTILGCGYGMAFRKFRETVKRELGILLSEVFSREVVATYRTTHSHVKELWDAIQYASMEAVKNPDRRYSVNKKITFRMSKKADCLLCELPSGRRLRYWYPRIEKKKIKVNDLKTGRQKVIEVDALTYLGRSSKNFQLQRESTYGGSLTENVVQAIARDLLCEAQVRAKAEDIRVKLNVHDEMGSETDRKGFTMKKYIALMTVSPAWAADLPLRAKGKKVHRFSEAK